MPKWFRILKEIGPTVLAFTPIAPLVPAIIAGIELAEQIPGATGAQKKAIVQQIAKTAAEGANAQAGHVVIDAASIETVAGSAIDTVVGVVNIIHQLPEAPPPSP